MAFETRVPRAREGVNPRARRRRPGAVALAALVLAGCAGGPRPEVGGPPVRPVADGPASVPVLRAAPCSEPAWAAEPARANLSTLDTLPWAGFGRPETGWAVYAPAVAAEVGSACPHLTPGFAADLLRWQQAQGLSATGAVGQETLDRFKAVWQGRRPFVTTRAAGAPCPAPPAPSRLEAAREDETLGGKPIQLRPGALAAYRRMTAAARAEVPVLNRDREALALFSGFRSPDYDAARCARDGNCQGVVRAGCSAHRTGLAMDVDVGHAPGLSVDSSADVNRLAQTRGPAYRWLLANARRFGFVNYVFEPWHWEWTGEAP